MPKIEIRPFKADTPNEVILNALRDKASPDYQSRIPEATKASVQDTLQHLLDNRPLWNEFVDALVNRIGLVLVKNNTWTNPLAKFKRGMMQFGDTIEEINVGLIKSKTYNADREALERDIFGNYPPVVQASYHKINRQEYYPITINEPLLQRAFLDGTGLSSFIGEVMKSPTNSDQVDEFLLTCSLFAEYHRAGGFFKVSVPDIADADSTAAEAKAFLRAARAYAGNLQFMSTAYNAAGMEIAANPEDLELFITPEALAAIDVEALAGAFNIDKAEMVGRITVIPKQNFGIEGAQAILTTKDFFVIADNRLEMAGIWNPVTLSNNQFFHHWEIISASRFVPAILFTSTEATTEISTDDTPVTSVSALTVTDESGATVTKVERGEFYQIVGSAITTPGGGENDAIRLELSGALSTKTKLTQEGTLRPHESESAANLTVTAYAVDDNTKTATVTVAVVGAKANYWPNPSVDEDTDEDGLYEVTPKDLEMVDTKVTIPTVKGVQYKKAGVNVDNGTVHTIAGTVAFSAVARSGSEIAAGAPVAWSFTV